MLLFKEEGFPLWNPSPKYRGGVLEYYVYQLRADGEHLPFYVGKGKGKRCSAHFSPSSLKVPSHKNRKIKKVLQGGGEVKVEFLEKNLSEAEAFEFEKFFISAYGRKASGGCLTNATDGGEGASGAKRSKEVIEKVAAAHRGSKRSQESRRRMSEAQRKIKKRCVGYKRTKETTQKYLETRAKNGGWVVSQETRLKLSEAGKGRIFGEASLEKMRSAHRGSGNPAATLNEEEVVHIYILLQMGVSKAEVARCCGTTYTIVYAIATARRWKHLHDKYFRKEVVT